MFAGPVSKVPFVLLSLKAQLPLLMNKPKEGVQALHELLHFCQSKSGAPLSAADSSSPEGMLCDCSLSALDTCCRLIAIAVQFCPFEKLTGSSAKARVQFISRDWAWSSGLYGRPQGFATLKQFAQKAGQH